MIATNTIESIVFATFVQNLHSLVAQALAVSSELQWEAAPLRTIDAHGNMLEELNYRASLQIPELPLDACKRDGDLARLSNSLVQAQSMLQNACEVIQHVRQAGDAEAVGDAVKTARDFVATAARELQSALDQIAEPAPQDLDREGTAESVDVMTL